MAPKQDIVLVTGSSGCLGQHIVKLLQEQDDDTVEIRLFDKEKYKNNLGHSEDKKMTEFVADIRDADKLLEAMEGVDCVMHVAAYIDLRAISDDTTTESVNVDGTRTVIDACLRKNIPRLIFASSTDILCGNDYIFYGSECSTPKPKTFNHGKYGESKWNAEEMVLKANGQLCSDGKTALRTLSLRPTAFYGEQDKYFVTEILKFAQKSNGRHYRVKRGDDYNQFMYVGNAAWAFLRAKEKLALDETVSGEAYFITDDTPMSNVHDFIQPFLECRGFKTMPFVIPYWLAWAVLSLLPWISKLVPTATKVEIPSVRVLSYFCSVIFFNRAKAALRLEYQPLYKPEEAMSRSLEFYKTVELG